jgi:glucose-1-phosphate thymidylyltransferase
VAITKGIVLAGGAGTRLYPVTSVACKQLLPVYDKPLIYYPLSSMMLFGIRDILLISTPGDLPRFQELFGDGSRVGLSLSYLAQPKPEGIAQAFLLGEEFIGRDSVMLILGDNIFYGIDQYYGAARSFESGALIFGYPVQDPGRYGVVQFDPQGMPVAIEEKPRSPKSQIAVTGMYLYDNTVIRKAKGLKPSSRGELEISELNQLYLSEGNLTVERLARGVAWLDTGTHETMLEAGNFIATIERRQGQKIACLEEIAYRQGLISRDQLHRLVGGMHDNSYRQYLETLLRESLG